VISVLNGLKCFQWLEERRIARDTRNSALTAGTFLKRFNPKNGWGEELVQAESRRRPANASEWSDDEKLCLRSLLASGTALRAARRGLFG
jgi:hypothetical protein